MLKEMIVRETSEAFDLDNQVTIEVATASFRGVRGYTLVAVLLDELAFWSIEGSANPDAEILSALRPAMATIPNAMLLVASSPYARRGALWEAYRKHFGHPGDVLIWQAATRRMNPTVSQAFIDAEYDRNASSAAAEYGAKFRSDIESFIAREVVESCVALGIRERAPRPGLRYRAFVDPSGGSADSFTLAIAHREADTLILDAIREVKPPFSPESVCIEFAELLKSYKVSRVAGDRYAGEWPREQFRKYGLQYELASQPKSILYQSLLPLLNSRRCALLDNPRLISQLVGLERRTARGGRDSIDHPPNAHDDIANAVAGALLAALDANKGWMRLGVFGYGGPVTEIDPRTGQPLHDEPIRIRWVTVDEADAPQARGP